MARPFYPYEADDPDLDWLISNFLYDRPNFVPVDAGVLPLVLIPVPDDLPEVPAHREPVEARIETPRETPSRKKLPLP